MWKQIDWYSSLLVLTLGIITASIYANRSFDVIDPKGYEWFPPFKPGINLNMNDHLGAEYMRISESLVAGRGFADPFETQTGPTAWMPPILPLYQAFWLVVFDNDKVALMNAIIVTQTFILWLTGLLVLILSRQTARNVPSLVITSLIAIALIVRFHSAFQVTHDSWLILFAVDVVIAGAIWGKVTSSLPRAITWGIIGGFTALCSPIAGLSWGLATLLEACRERTWRFLMIAGLTAFVTLSPWLIRNAIVFGRFIPVKSNLSYELYQSQLLTKDGRLTSKVFATHPYSTNGIERADYAEKGEMAFLDEKRAIFWRSVHNSPGLYVDKVYDRLLATSLDYSPMDDHEYDREFLYTLCYTIHPLPIFALISLLVLSPFLPLPRATWFGIVLLIAYLTPYVIVSYYDRYEFPLWGVKLLLIVWWLNTVIDGIRNLFGFSREEIRGGVTTE